MNQQKQKVYFDRRTKPLAPLEEGDMVRIQPFTSNKKTWSHGEVLTRLDDRSYDIKAGNQVIRRNRVHLKSTNENPLTSCEHASGLNTTTSASSDQCNATTDQRNATTSASSDQCNATTDQCNATTD